ncbi:DUF4440 domain-containing protein [Ensifer adhaerens]|uniref:nuclear transport factor 2 family protein n=1 Tax=Ensifer canadensis TaxID=555315 RepID=UPI00148F50CF|nr:DUF4440 domain-containing protein [Ensifer canadensis]NOV21181.1 DUF4440 domain-containing protein [Ensifer canadensis]
MSSADPNFAEIQFLEEALHRPSVRHSRIAIEALLAEDFIEFGASGRVYRRAEVINLLSQGEDETDSILRTSNYALAPISQNAVLLTYQSHLTYRDGSERSALRSSIWKHDGKKWQILFHQGTMQRP